MAESLHRIVGVGSYGYCHIGAVSEAQDSLRVITARGLLSSANKYPADTHPLYCHLSPHKVPSLTLSPVLTTRPSAPTQASSQGASRTTVPRHPDPSTPWR